MGAHICTHAGLPTLSNVITDTDCNSEILDR